MRGTSKERVLFELFCDRCVLKILTSSRHHYVGRALGTFLHVFLSILKLNQGKIQSIRKIQSRVNILGLKLIVTISDAGTLFETETKNDVLHHDKETDPVLKKRRLTLLNMFQYKKNG